MPDWPTAVTKPIWLEFLHGFVPLDGRAWSEQKFWANVNWSVSPPTPPDTPLRAHHLDGQPLILSATGDKISVMFASINVDRAGLLRVRALASVTEENAVLL